MGTEEEDEDFVFYGTPIEREEEISVRKRKTISDSGSLRSLPTWKQEVRDEEGRRRLHGAFTGGFSAGYYNTVGSKEGWTPQTFSSSRRNRAEVKKQSIYSFLDEEDKKDMGGQGLETSLKFDTFGFTAAEHARKLAEKEQKSRPSAIPGLVPDEMLVPVASSIGIKLLLKMGWRRGHSIKETQANSLNDARREARKALLAFSGNDVEEVAQTDIALSNAGEPTQMGDDAFFSSKTTPAYVINPKQDLYGLGFDPFKHAPEFRDRKESMARNDHPGSKRVNSMIGNLFVSNSGKYAPGFGIGALEELDVEDEDIYATGLELAGNEVQEDEISRIVVDGKLSLGNSKKGILHGFKVALKSDYSLERFDPPIIPPDFTPHHKFASPLETVDKLLEPPPPEVPPPDDDNLRLLIDGFANLVSRCGKLFEDLSKEKHRSNPLFSFLNGGSGNNYYTWKLWEAKRRRADQEKHTAMESIPSDQRMTAENRGKLLGEKPLERSSNVSMKSASLKEVVQFPTNLSDTFANATKFVGPSEHIKPFEDDPLRQKRFELFLKEKHEGGLRSSSFSGASKMSESERARERLDFEAAAEAIAKFEQSAKDSLQTKQKSTEFSKIGDEHFVSSSGGQISQDEDKLVGKVLPTREEFQWRPSPILCKRFDILDPYMGKPPPAPRPRSKMDALIFMVDSNLDSKKEAIPTSTRDQSSSAAHKDSIKTAHLEAENANKLAAEQAEAALSLHMQKPVDLYKAIFSDDSEDDSSIKETAKLDKTSEVTNTTLNSLIAGDFLESLGKELGLEVPAEAKEVRVYDSKPPEIEPPSVCPSNVHQSYEKESSSAESPRPENTNPRRENTKVVTIDGHGDRDNVFLGHKTKEIDRKKEPRKHRGSSRRRRGGSESDSSSSGSGYHDRSRSGKKVSSSRKHARHSKHKSSRSHGRYPSEESKSELSDDSRRGRSSKDTRKQHSGRSKSDGKKNL